MGTRWTAVVVGVALLGAGIVGARARGHATDPIDPGNFSQPVDNPYFPLEVGQVSVLRGQEDGERFFERVRVMERTKQILGIDTTVVRDLLWENGHLAERTFDWYAPDDDGNVWYLGENTATLDRHGNVIDTAGSWQAGADGAVAGTIMPSDPRPTDAYRQELYRGQAEDQGWIVQRNVERTVPYGHLTGLVRSFEWSRLEPRVLVQKFYAAGLGLVYERVVAGGVESLELVAFEEAGSSMRS